MKLYVVVPSCRDWKPQFGSSICGLVHRISTKGIKGIGLEGFNMNIMQNTSVLPRARQLGIEAAIKDGYTHVLFLDDDMRFSPDLVDDLSRHGEKVVGINYARKNPNDASPMACGLDGKPVTSKGKTGAEEVGWVGFGAVLIDLSAVKDIPAPLFEMKWLPERNDFLGEDFYFCAKVREYGSKIFVDHDASNKAAHVGDYPYREI